MSSEQNEKWSHNVNLISEYIKVKFVIVFSSFKLTENRTQFPDKDKNLTDGSFQRYFNLFLT